MSIVENTLEDGFDDLHELCGTTATFTASGINVIEGEASEVAEYIMGGIEEDITGVVIAQKQDFGTLPEVGDFFTLHEKEMRVIELRGDERNPLISVAYNFTGDEE